MPRSSVSVGKTIDLLAFGRNHLAAHPHVASAGRWAGDGYDAEATPT